MQNEVKVKQFIKKNPTRRNNVSKFYYSIFIWNSTCFGRHTAHHQEHKTALAASGFFIRGKLLGRVFGGRCQAHTVPHNVHQIHVQQSPTYEKTRGCQYSFRLLMVDGVSSETRWASYKYEIMKLWYSVASC